MLFLLIYILPGIILFIALLYLLNWLSYTWLKNKVLNKNKWDLNICCGKTDGGGINADIIRHADVRNFVLIPDMYHLPFADRQFGTILCSHTIEHIDDPLLFHRELSRIGENITYLLPPLWDISAAFNIFEHRWLFFTLVSEHRDLPMFIKLPFAGLFQKVFGQQIKA
jgi:hypothetical protein